MADKKEPTVTNAEEIPSVKPFDCIIDTYNGTILKPSHYGDVDADTFRQRLKASLAKWRQDGRRGAWVKIPISKSHLVSVAVELGYVYHHAQPEYLMLTQWLSENEENALPKYAGAYLGAGGLVVNGKGQILTVQERYSPLLKRHWKLPGGQVEPSEHLTEAVVREVEEETGIKTEFDSLICFRHMQEYRFGCADLYFVFRLRPLPGTDTTPRANPREIHDCRWMDIGEYLSQDLTQTNRLIAESFVKGNSLPSHLVKTEIPHYVSSKPNMMVYSLDSKVCGKV